ncbi:SHOCT domain-containing protein [Micromonospora sp. MS34]|uniref:SHOCT domain-containing protein n=1 Tax=Micromonospora sp. MS34 TaxID=3385971 RepID=UPI00399F0CD8
MHDNGWFWPMGLMMVGWLLLAVIIAAAVWLAVGRVRRPTHPNESARRILADRYARGELSDEDYQRRLDGLR